MRMNTTPPFLSWSILVLGLIVEVMIFVLLGVSTLVTAAFGMPYLYLVAFAGVALIAQWFALRRPVAGAAVARTFLLLVVPVWWIACPAAHAALTASHVGGKVLDSLRRGDVDGACSYFGNDAFVADFKSEVKGSALLGLRSWTLVDSTRVWHEQGSADFDVVCADGRERRVDIEVWGRYFMSAQAFQFCATER
jgi:hypothetical protein